MIKLFTTPDVDWLIAATINSVWLSDEPVAKLVERLMNDNGVEATDVKRVLIGIAVAAKDRSRTYSDWADQIVRFVKFAKVQTAKHGDDE
jgi:hypothetical protein